jgi:hypothetical protein
MALPICGVCDHPQHLDIDNALSAGGTVRDISARYGISKSAVHRHKVAHLAPKIAAVAKVMQGVKAAREPVQRAKSIAAGTVQPNIDDVLSLTGLLERVAQTLNLLQGNAKAAAEEGLHGSLAALSAQTFRGVETAAKLQGLYETTPAPSGNDKFSIEIVLGQQPNAAPTHSVIDVTPAPKTSAPAPRIPSKDFGIQFNLGDSLDASLDAVEALTED